MAPLATTSGRKARILGACAAASLTLAAWQAGHAEQARGTIGITLSVSGGGVLMPSIREVSVVSVVLGGPAEKAGITPGDKVLEVDGKRIAGASAASLTPLAKGKHPGEAVSVELQRPDGSVYKTTVITRPPAR